MFEDRQTYRVLGMLIIGIRRTLRHSVRRKRNFNFGVSVFDHDSCKARGNAPDQTIAPHCGDSDVVRSKGGESGLHEIGGRTVGKQAHDPRKLRLADVHAKASKFRELQLQRRIGSLDIDGNDILLYFVPRCSEAVRGEVVRADLISLGISIVKL